MWAWKCLSFLKKVLIKTYVQALQLFNKSLSLHVTYRPQLPLKSVNYFTRNNLVLASRQWTISSNISFLSWTSVISFLIISVGEYLWTQESRHADLSYLLSWCKRGYTLPPSLAQWVQEGEKAPRVPSHGPGASLSPCTATMLLLLAPLQEYGRQGLDGQQAWLLPIALGPRSHRIIKSFRLEKTFKIIKSTTKPCP